MSMSCLCHVYVMFQKYEVEFLLQQQWIDLRLWYSNSSSYDFLNAIHHHQDMWLPDTYFIMHGDFKEPLIPVHFVLRIHRNGTVNYLMRYVSKDSCLMSTSSWGVSSMFWVTTCITQYLPSEQRIVGNPWAPLFRPTSGGCGQNSGVLAHNMSRPHYLPTNFWDYLPTVFRLRAYNCLQRQN